MLENPDVSVMSVISKFGHYFSYHGGNACAVQVGGISDVRNLGAVSPFYTHGEPYLGQSVMLVLRVGRVTFKK